MESKTIMRVFMLIGATAGAYVPYLWGAGMFSMSSIFTSAIGAMVGIWLAFKLTR